MKMTTFFSKLILLCFVLASLAGFAQSSSGPSAGSPSAGSSSARSSNSPNEKAINAYYTAFEKKDWNLLQPFLADGFTFSSPLDDHIDINAFKERCWPNAGKIKKFEVVKMMVNGNSAFVIYNGWTNEGKLFRNSDYFIFKDGKIKAYECFFGPGINYPNSGK